MSGCVAPLKPKIACVKSAMPVVSRRQLARAETEAEVGGCLIGECGLERDAIVPGDFAGPIPEPGHGAATLRPGHAKASRVRFG